MSDNNQWPSLIARIRQAAAAKLQNNKSGLAIISIQILVNRSGEPISWIEPSCRRIEPSRDAIPILIKHFSQDI